jgi:hypothetical protein
MKLCYLHEGGSDYLYGLGLSYIVQVILLVAQGVWVDGFFLGACLLWVVTHVGQVFDF